MVLESQLPTKSSTYCSPRPKPYPRHRRGPPHRAKPEEGGGASGPHHPHPPRGGVYRGTSLIRNHPHPPRCTPPRPPVRRARLGTKSGQARLGTPFQAIWARLGTPLQAIYSPRPPLPCPRPAPDPPVSSLSLSLSLARSLSHTHTHSHTLTHSLTHSLSHSPGSLRGVSPLLEPQSPMPPSGKTQTRLRVQG